jgi:hypothetical protein
VTDWLGAGNTIAELEKRAESAGPWIPPYLAQTPAKPGLDVVCMADVSPTAIEYLWPNWIALGKVHEQMGPPVSEGLFLSKGRGYRPLIHGAADKKNPPACRRCFRFLWLRGWRRSPPRGGFGVEFFSDSVT